MSRVVTAFGLVLLLSACPTDEECAGDSDCGAGETCDDGACVDDDDEGSEGEGEGEGDDGFALCCVTTAEGTQAFDCDPADNTCQTSGNTAGCFRNGGRDPEC